MKLLFFILTSFYVCLSSSLAKKSSENTTTARKITISGVSNKNILKAIDEQMIMHSENPTELERNFLIKRNTDTIRKILCAFGYFEAEVFPQGTFDKFNIKLNEHYTVNSVECSYIGYNISEKILNEEQFFTLTGLKKGNYFLGSEVSSSTNKIRDFYRNLGFAFVQVKTPNIELNKKSKTVNIKYNVDLGDLTKIKDIIINIKSKKSPELLKPLVKNKLTFKSGDRYNPKEIDRLKDALIKYELFSSLDVELSEPITDKNGSDYAMSDIVLNIEEAPLRSVKLGANFSTTNVFNILAGWKHYNIDGKGSTFEVLGNIGRDEQTFKVEHNYYDLFTKNQKLSSQAKFTHEDEISYNVIKYCINGTLWHNLRNQFEFGIGCFGEYSKTVDKVVAGEKLINTNIPYITTFGIPLGVKFDNTDNDIDPRRGFKINADFIPMFSKDVTYSKFVSSIKCYSSFDNNYFKKSLVFAFYAKYGTICGSTTKLTRDKMFFAGGSNSIRGYGEKKLGILLNRTPYGGSSLIELGAECRFKYNDAVGSVAFVETGKLYTSEKQQNWMTGVGFGIRYTPPLNLPVIRVDIAFPTHRRKDNEGKYIDSLFNVYIGIGQAF